MSNGNANASVMLLLMLMLQLRWLLQLLQRIPKSSESQDSQLLTIPKSAESQDSQLLTKCSNEKVSLMQQNANMPNVQTACCCCCSCECQAVAQLYVKSLETPRRTQKLRGTPRAHTLSVLEPIHASNACLRMTEHGVSGTFQTLLHSRSS